MILSSFLKCISVAFSIISSIYHVCMCACLYSVGISSYQVNMRMKDAVILLYLFVVFLLVCSSVNEASIFSHTTSINIWFICDLLSISFRYDLQVESNSGCCFYLCVDAGSAGTFVARFHNIAELNWIGLKGYAWFVRHRNRNKKRITEKMYRTHFEDMTLYTKNIESFPS